METVDLGYFAGAFEETVGKASRGVVESNFVVNFQGFFLGFFGVGGNFEIFIAVYQWIRGVGDCQARGFIVSLWWSSGKIVEWRGLVESNFIIIFCIFWGCWWGNCDFLVNMGIWRLSRQGIGYKRWQERRWGIWLQVWCRFCFFLPYSSFSLD